MSAGAHNASYLDFMYKVLLLQLTMVVAAACSRALRSSTSIARVTGSCGNFCSRVAPTRIQPVSLTRAVTSTSEMHPRAHAVLEFWFGAAYSDVSDPLSWPPPEQGSKRWYDGGAELDQVCCSTCMPREACLSGGACVHIQVLTFCNLPPPTAANTHGICR